MNIQNDINKLDFHGNTNELNNIATTSFSSVAIGQNSAKINTGENNVFLGFNSGYNGSSNIENVFIGANSGKNISSSSNNVFIGSHTCSENKNIDNNTIIGFSSSKFLDNGLDNTIIGAYSGLNQYNSKGNSIVGSHAFMNTSNTYYNVVIGYDTGNNYESGSNNILIGYLADSIDKNIDNSIVIGKSKLNSQSITIGHNTTSIQDTNINIGNNVNTNSYNNISIGNTQNIQNLIIFQDTLKFHDKVLETKKRFGIYSIQFSTPNLIFRDDNELAGLQTITTEIHNSDKNNVRFTNYANNYKKYNIPNTFQSINTFNWIFNDTNIDDDNFNIYSLKGFFIEDVIFNNQYILVGKNNIKFDRTYLLHPDNINNTTRYLYIYIKKFPSYHTISKNKYSLDENIYFYKKPDFVFQQYDSIELCPVLVINDVEIKGITFEQVIKNNDYKEFLTGQTIYQTGDAFTLSNCIVSTKKLYKINLSNYISVNNDTDDLIDTLISAKQFYEIELICSQNSDIIVNDENTINIQIPIFYQSGYTNISVNFSNNSSNYFVEFSVPVNRIYLETLPKDFISTVNEINSSTKYTGNNETCLGRIINENNELSSELLNIHLINSNYEPNITETNQLTPLEVISQNIIIKIYQFGRIYLNNILSENIVDHPEDIEHFFIASPKFGYIGNDDNGYFYRNLSNIEYDTFKVQSSFSRFVSSINSAVNIHVYIVNNYDITLAERFIYDSNTYDISIYSSLYSSNDLFQYYINSENIDEISSNNDKTIKYSTNVKNSSIDFFPIYASNIDDFDFIVSNVSLGDVYNSIKYHITSNTIEYKADFVSLDDDLMYIKYVLNETCNISDYNQFVNSNIEISWNINPVYPISQISINSFKYTLSILPNYIFELTNDTIMLNDEVLASNIIINENQDNTIQLKNSTNLEIHVNDSIVASLNYRLDLQYTSNIVIQYNVFDTNNFISNVNTDNIKVQNYGVSLYFSNFSITVDNNNSNVFNVAIANFATIVGKGNIVIGKDFNMTADDSIILGNNIASNGELYNSIVIGNTSLIKSSGKNIILIGNNSLNDIYDNSINVIQKEKELTEFFAQNPIIIGNSIAYDPNTTTNIANAFIRSKNNYIYKINIGLGESVFVGYTLDNIDDLNNTGLYIKDDLYIQNQNILHLINSNFESNQNNITNTQSNVDKNLLLFNTSNDDLRNQIQIIEASNLKDRTLNAFEHNLIYTTINISNISQQNALSNEKYLNQLKFQNIYQSMIASNELIENCNTYVINEINISNSIQNEHLKQIDTYIYEINNCNVYQQSSIDIINCNIQDIYNSNEIQNVAINSIVQSYWTKSNNDIFFSSGNIGINTSSTKFKLFVNEGKTNLDNVVIGRYEDDVNYIELRHLNTIETTKSYALKQSSNGITTINSSLTNNLYFGINDDTKMIIRHDGNVGINNNTPNEKLDIIGNINISSEYNYLIDGIPITLDDVSISNFDTRFYTKTTDDITQGINNKFFTNNLASAAFNYINPLYANIDSSTGVSDISLFYDTDQFDISSNKLTIKNIDYNTLLNKPDISILENKNIQQDIAIINTLTNAKLYTDNSITTLKINYIDVSDSNTLTNAKLYTDSEIEYLKTEYINAQIVDDISQDNFDAKFDAKNITSSQWTTGKNNIYYTTGNVGIGTDTPSEKLHIVGDALISTNLTVQGNLTVNGTTTTINTDTQITDQLIITNNGTGPAVDINQTGVNDIINIKDDGVSVFYIKDGGNIGIKTKTPHYTLDVVGDINLTGTLLEKGVPFSGASQQASINAIETCNVSQQRIIQTLLTDVSAIETCNVNQKNSIDNLNEAVSAIETCNVNQKNSIDNLNEAVSAIETCNVNQKNSIDNLNEAVSAINTYNQSLNAEIVNNTNKIVSLTTDDIPDDSATNKYSQWTGTGNDIYYTTGNVGIGITAPQQKLSVYGNNTDTTAANSGFIVGFSDKLHINGWTGIGLGGFHQTLKSGIIHERLGTYGRGNLHFVNNNVDSPASATISDAKLTILSDGNVGIGKTDPVSKLHIEDEYSTTNLNETSGLFLSTKNASDSWGVGYIGGYIKSGVNNSTSGYPGGLVFKTKPANGTANMTLTTQMVLNSAGNLGIGTTDPKTILNIVKDTEPRLRITATNPGDSTGIQLLEVNNDNPSYGSELVYDGNNNIFNINMLNGTSYTALTILSSNRNVGIGKTEPANKLDVNGGISVGKGVLETDDYTLLKFDTYRPWEFNTKDNGGALQLKTTSSAKYFYIDNRNDQPIATFRGEDNAGTNLSWANIFHLGINTNPNTAYKLDVNGSTLIRDNLIINDNVGINNSSPPCNLTVNTEAVHRNSYNHSEAQLLLTHTATRTSSTTLNDPKKILHLSREGTGSQAYAAKASFSLSRYENASTDSRTRLDLTLAHERYDDVNVLTVLSSGNVGIGTTVPDSILHLSKKNSVEGTTPNTFTGYHNLTEYLRFVSKGDPQDVNAISVGFKLGQDSTTNASPNGRVDICANQNANANNDYGAIPNKTIASFIGNGNVGIGTTDPDAKLHVSGEVRIQGSSTHMSHYNYGDNQDVYIRTGTDNVGSKVIIADRSTNTYVGIGKTDPASKLDVVGDVNISSGSSYKIGNSYLNLRDLEGTTDDITQSGSKIFFNIPTTPNILNALQIDGVSANEARFLRFRKGGNTGSVNGICLSDYNTHNFFNYADSGIYKIRYCSNYTTTLYYNRPIGTTTTTDIFKLDASGNVDITGKYKINGYDLQYSDLSYTPIILNQFIVYPPSDLTTYNWSGNTLTIANEPYGNGDYIVSSTSSYSTFYTKYVLTGQSGYGGHWVVNKYNSSTLSYTGNDYIVDDFKGDYIKVEFPNSFVLRKSSFVARSGVQYRCPGIFKIYGSHDGSVWTEIHHQSIRLNNPEEEFFIYNTISYKYYALSVNELSSVYGESSHCLNFKKWNMYAGNVYIKGDVNITGNVGIGTTDPKTILNIVKAGDPRLRITGLEGLGFRSAGIQLLESENNTTTYGTELVYDGDNNKFNIKMFAGSPQTRLTILRDNGNVGIGTTAPANKLDVNGDFSVNRTTDAWSSSPNPGIYMKFSTHNESGYIQSIKRSTDLKYPLNFEASKFNIKGGNVGIDTYSPAYKLDVNGSARIGDNLIINSGNVGIGTTDPQTILNIVKASDPRLRITGIGSNGTAGIQLLEVDNNNLRYGFELVYDGNTANKFYIKMFNNYTISTALTILRDNGNVGIGKTDPDAKLDVNGDTHITGDLHVSQDIIAYSTTIASDNRLKHNIKKLTGYDIIKNLNPVSFNWNSNVINETLRGEYDVGLIAQEVEQHIPTAVKDKQMMDGNNFKTINYNNIIPYIILSLQDVYSRLDEKTDNHNNLVGYVVSTTAYNEYPVVELSKEAFCQNIFGVISSSPKCVREAYFHQTKISINSNGQGDIWVCNYGNNQNIKKGALLTSSSIAGLAMCQNKNEKLDDTIRNYTVAKNMKDIDFVNDTNKIYVNIEGIEITKELYDENQHYVKVLTKCVFLC